MSRYFQSQPVEFLDDAMYKPPAELMASVIQAKDQQADEFFGSLKELQDEVEVDPHAQDVDAAREQENLITGIIDETTQTGLNDVANLYKYQGSLKKAQRKIGDIIDKEINPINKHNKAIKAEKERVFKQYDEKPEDFPHVSSKKELGALIDSQYPGYRDEEGVLTQTPTVTLRGKESNLDIMKKLLEGNTAMSYSESYANEYTNFSNAWKGLEKTELQSLIGNHIQSDDKLKSYLKQKVEIAKLKGETTDYALEEAKLKSEIYAAGEEQFIERKVQHGQKPRNTNTGTDTDKDPDIIATSQKVTVVENPYYNSDYKKDIAERGEDSVLESLKKDIISKANNIEKDTKKLFAPNDATKQKILEDFGISDIRMSDPESEHQFQILGIDEEGNETVLDPIEVFSNFGDEESEAKLNQFKQNAELYEAYNILNQSVDENNFKQILSKEKFNVNTRFTENPLGPKYSGETKDMVKKVEKSVGGKGVSGAMVSVADLQVTPLGAKGDTFMVFLDDYEYSEGLVKNSEEWKKEREKFREQAKAKAREDYSKYGDNINLIYVEGQQDKTEDGYIKMSFIQQYLTKVDKIKTRMVADEPTAQQRAMFSDSKELMDLILQPSVQTSITSETPSVVGQGDIQFNQDLTQGLAPVVAKQSVRVGTGSSQGYNIPIVMNVDGLVTNEHKALFTRAQREYASLGAVLNGLSQRNIINKDGTTELKLDEVVVSGSKIKTENGLLYKDGKIIEDENTARILIAKLIKATSKRTKE